MKRTDDVETDQHNQLKQIAQNFLSEPLTKYSCGYKMVSPVLKDSIYHSIKTSLLPEFKSDQETKTVLRVARLMVDFQNTINKILNNISAIREFITSSSPKSETDIYCLTPNEDIFYVQRIDYLVDTTNNIKVIDPNVIPLGLGLFFIRDNMMCNHIESLKKILNIDHRIRGKNGFSLAGVADMLAKWQEKYPTKGSKTIHIVTEKEYNNNLDHEFICRELRKHKVDIKISFLQDLRFNPDTQILTNLATGENINYVWRYGRFPNKDMDNNWGMLYEAIKGNSIKAINKPGIYALENKIFLSLFFIEGFQDILKKYFYNNNLSELKKYLPFTYLLKINKKRGKIYSANSINQDGILSWNEFDLEKLPRSYVFKTPDTSGSRGVRLVINESNRKCQKYFWEFIELFPDRNIFIISEFIKTEKRKVIDPATSELLPEDYIPKNHVFFSTASGVINLIGFSTFARKYNYKVHGTQDTISIVEYH